MKVLETQKGEIVFSSKVCHFFGFFPDLIYFFKVTIGEDTYSALVFFFYIESSLLFPLKFVFFCCFTFDLS